jgi:hypothetical protein
MVVCVRRGLREQALDRLPLSPANSACRKEQGSSPRAGARIDLALIGSLRTGAASACPFDLGVAIEDDVTPGNATGIEGWRTGWRSIRKNCVSILFGFFASRCRSLMALACFDDDQSQHPRAPAALQPFIALGIGWDEIDDRFAHLTVQLFLGVLLLFVGLCFF